MNEKNETKAEEAKKQSLIAKTLAAIAGVGVAAAAVIFRNYRKRDDKGNKKLYRR